MNTRKRGQTSNDSANKEKTRRSQEPCPLGCVNKNGKLATHVASRCPQRKKQEANIETPIESQPAGSSSSESQPATEGPVAMPRVILPTPPAILTEQPQVVEPQQQKVVGLQHPVVSPAPPPPAQSIDELMDKMFGEAQESGEDEEDTALDSPRRQSPSGGSDLEDEVGDENPAPNNNEDEGSTNNNELSQITAPPPSNSAHVGRIEKIIHINKFESKPKKTTDYVWNNKARAERFCKKRKALAKALQDLGATTGCYGYLYLS